MPIHVLSQEVVAQIAAGEVVERPASVVKELVENALDAGAAHVRVVIQGDGRRMIRVSDDGSGILAAEVELAFARHATSKLTTIDDLSVIRTLGFRGEALSSIASVSHLTITTRHESEAMGITMTLEGGQMQRSRAVGAPMGTVISVEHLFYNTPARLKFLKTEGTEKRQIAAVITRYAMAYPQVRFVLEQDGRELFRSSGSGNLADVLVSALGLDEFKNMLEVSGEEVETDSGNAIQVYGFTSSPSYNRADRSKITLFINGRWVQDTTLTYAIIQAYHTLLMTGRYPVAVLMIDMPPHLVDVNVHPTKAEVRFQNADAIFSAVQRAVRRSVIDHAQTPTLRGKRYSDAVERALAGWNPEHEAGRQLDMELSLDAGRYARGAATPEQAQNLDDGFDLNAIPEGAGAPAKPRTLPPLRVVAQVAASYIVAEGPAGMYLIDQHAAHERILYEQFMEQHARHEPVVQMALAAQTVQLAAPEAHLIEDNLDLLQHLGFDLEGFGPNTFIIRSIPAMLADDDPREVVAAIVEDLEQGKTPGQASIEEKIVKRVCKQAAVKAGQILSFEEMQGLIRQLERCDSPLTCPHGRPTMIYMSSDHLAREFGRMG